MVSYLILYSLVGLFVFGMVYSVVSDTRDIFVPLFTSLGAMSEFHDADTIWTFDFLNFLLSFSIMFFVIGMIHFGYVMAQKPEQPWG